MTYVYDVEKDVVRFNAVWDPFIARIMLGGLFGRYGRDRVCRLRGQQLVPF